MIFAVADIHAGRSMHKSTLELGGDSFAALKRLSQAIIDHPCGNETKHLIVAGDIYDLSKIDGASIKAVGDFCSDLTEHGVEIYFVQGNHDRQDSHNPYAVPLILGNATEEARFHMHHLNGQVLTVDGRTLTGFDYSAPEKLREKLELVKTDMLVLHQAFEEVLAIEGAFDLSFEDIPQSVKHCIVGDIHKAACLAIDPSRTRFFLSPGALHPCAIDQGPAHGYFALPKGSNQWEFRSIPTRNIQKMELDSDAMAGESFEEELQAMQVELQKLKDESGLKPVLVLYHLREKADLVKRVREVLGDTCVIIEHPTSSGKLLNTDIIPSSLTKYERLTLEKALPFACNVDTCPEVYKLLETLLTGGESKLVIESFINEQAKQEGIVL